MSFLNILLIIGAILVAIFLVLVIVLYIRNNRSAGKIEDAAGRATPAVAGATPAMYTAADFEKRNDDHSILFDSGIEQQKFNASQPFDQEKARFESEKPASKAKPQDEKDSFFIPDEPVVTSKPTATTAAASAGFAADDFFSQLENTTEQPTETFGSPESALMSGDGNGNNGAMADIHEELSRREQRRQDKDRRKAEEKSHANQKKDKGGSTDDMSSFFSGLDNDAPATFGAAASVTPSASAGGFEGWGMEDESAKDTTNPPKEGINPNASGVIAMPAAQTAPAAAPDTLANDLFFAPTATKSAEEIAREREKEETITRIQREMEELRNKNAKDSEVETVRREYEKQLEATRAEQQKNEILHAEQEREKKREEEMRQMQEKFQAEMKALQESLNAEKAKELTPVAAAAAMPDNLREKELERQMQAQKAEFEKYMKDQKAELERQKREEQDRMERARREEEMRQMKEKFQAEVRSLQDALASERNRDRDYSEAARFSSEARGSYATERNTSVTTVDDTRSKELERQLEATRAEFARFVADQKAEKERRDEEERRAKMEAERKRIEEEQKAEFERQQQQHREAIAQMKEQHKEAMALMQAEMADVKTRMREEKDKKSDNYAGLAAEKNEKEEAIAREKQEFETLRREFETMTKEFLKQQKEQMEVLNEERRKAAEAREAAIADTRADAEKATRELFERMREEIAGLKEQTTAKRAEDEEDDEGVAEIERTLATQGDELTNISHAMQQLLEERKKSREEAQALKEEFEQERIENQKRLEEQFQMLKNGLEKQKQAEFEKVVQNIEQKQMESELAAAHAQLEVEERDALIEERDAIIESLRREKDQNEAELRRQYDELQQQVEKQTQEAIRQSEEVERQLKEQYDAYKDSIASEAKDLEQKNRELLKKLEKASAHSEEELRARIADQLRAEYDQNERLLSEKYLQLRTELQRESKQLAEKSDEVKQEMDEVRRQRELIAMQSASSSEVYEVERHRLEIEHQAELERLEREHRAEKHRLEQEIRAEIAATPGVATVVQTVVDTEEVERLKAQLQYQYQQNELALRQKYEAMQAEVQRNEQVIEARRAELAIKEEQITTEERRIFEQSREVHTLITERSYTKEERNRILADYRVKIEELRERLRANEKSIRENNKEYVPLRRIKDTLDRDLRLLRKREAIVAKQQVMVYGVNNITTLDPERIKKLKQDTDQVAGLRTSVANCEDIMARNKDRYPTLASLDRVLKSTNEQIRTDIKEVEEAIMFFENYVPGNGDKK